MFLDSDGFSVGPKDFEAFAKIKQIDPALENLCRWHRYMTNLQKKQGEQPEAQGQKAEIQHEAQ